jgi:hypothetical protein
VAGFEQDGDGRRRVADHVDAGGVVDSVRVGGDADGALGSSKACTST